MRFAALTCVLALVAAPIAAGATKTDGALALDVATGVKKVGKQFAATVVVKDASETYESYNLTVTVSAPAAIQIVKATSSFTIPLTCTRALHSLACKGRMIGGSADLATHSQIVIFKPVKAGKFKLTAKVAIEGDTNTSNDTATKSVTIKPKPKPRHS